MNTATTSERAILRDNDTNKAVEPLQMCLATLIDLALQLKQAHWNLTGDRFLSFHIQLDTIIETTRTASDDVAERIATLGVAADGRPDTVANSSKLQSFPAGKQGVDATVSMVADRLEATSHCLRNSMQSVSAVDPVSEDLLIGICSTIEKHLWMVQSQEQ